MKNWVGLRCFWTAITTLASFGQPGAIGNLVTLAKRATRSVASMLNSTIYSPIRLAVKKDNGISDKKMDFCFKKKIFDHEILAPNGALLDFQFLQSEPKCLPL